MVPKVYTPSDTHEFAKSLARFVYGLTEPLLTPIRQVLPSMGGLGISPMVLLFALQILKGFFR